MLIIQMLVSFVAGGVLISLISLLAEKVNQQIAGIILMFPTTMVLGFFFLGITTSAGHVADIVPATLIPLSIVVFFSVFYIQAASFYSRYITSKRTQIVCTALTAAGVWMMIVIPFAVYQFRSLSTGIVCYLLMTTIALLLLNRKKLNTYVPRPVYTRSQILLRAIFTGSVVSLVVLLAKTLNPFWGGIFAMFPAATFATLATLHFYYEPQQLFYFIRRAPVGTLSLFAYAMAALQFFPMFGVIWGTIASYFFSLLVTFLLIGYQKWGGAIKLRKSQ